MKQKILLVSHCFFNDAAKLKNQNKTEMEEERSVKRKFLKRALDAGIELIQLPCPELILYGSDRWGHSASQFDHPHFRQEARKMLEPVLLQIKEYMAHSERFEVLGVLGIDGSPSCGIHYTFDGAWGGEFTGNDELERTLADLDKVNRPGIFMDVFRRMLSEEQLLIEFYSTDTFPDFLME